LTTGSNTTVCSLKSSSENFPLSKGDFNSCFRLSDGCSNGLVLNGEGEGSSKQEENRSVELVDAKIFLTPLNWLRAAKGLAGVGKGL